MKGRIISASTTEPRETPLCIGISPECSPPTCARETRPENYFNSPHDDIIKTEEHHFRQKKSVIDGVKGLGKIKADNIKCETLVHYARHRFLKTISLG